MFAPAARAIYVPRCNLPPPPCSPWMSLTLKVKPSKAPKIPAVLHVDATSRLQTVTSSRSPFYHTLIKKFFEATGVPMVLNTSFNTVKGEVRGAC